MSASDLALLFKAADLWEINKKVPSVYLETPHK